MANSPYEDTSFVMEFLEHLEPGSILDVGAGMGRWGFLARCHLGPGESLEASPDQDLRIDAVEVFERNISSIYKAIYNKVIQADIRDAVKGLAAYDVIICGHVMEHFEKQVAEDLIGALLEKTRKALILCFPFNDSLREPVSGNKYEAHLSQWHPRDFMKRSAIVKTFKVKCGYMPGVVIMPVSGDAQWIGKFMTNPLRRLIHQLRRI